MAVAALTVFSFQFFGFGYQFSVKSELKTEN